MVETNGAQKTETLNREQEKSAGGMPLLDAIEHLCFVLYDIRDELAKIVVSADDEKRAREKLLAGDLSMFNDVFNAIDERVKKEIAKTKDSQEPGPAPAQKNNDAATSSGVAHIGKLENDIYEQYMACFNKVQDGLRAAETIGARFSIHPAKILEIVAVVKAVRRAGAAEAAKDTPEN